MKIDDDFVLAFMGCNKKFNDSDKLYLCVEKAVELREQLDEMGVNIYAGDNPIIGDWDTSMTKWNMRCSLIEFIIRLSAMVLFRQARERYIEVVNPTTFNDPTIDENENKEVAK